MVNERICTSVTSTDFSECEQVLRSSQMAELRLDLMLLHTAQIQALLLHKIPTVVTCREGKYAQNERVNLLKFAIENGATFVDIEVESEESYRKTLVDFAKKHGCKVIISYHNFECTPSFAELKQIIAECRSMGADVVKLITTAHTAQDSARVLSLYESKENLVAFAMGEAGKITRLACLYLGAPFTYASMGTGKEAAPGQISAEKMGEVVKIVGNTQ
ncbi:MAG: type I 3-dehydroquinate dehydratase [Prevotellaceae bacterium]|jgi:3-dehydroquinate dehydratase type I|nr:type I 3-dehydroquinate dehydratase [Prevotellaceae bacterium]